MSYLAVLLLFLWSFFPCIMKVICSALLEETKLATASDSASICFINSALFVVNLTDLLFLDGNHFSLKSLKKQLLKSCEFLTLSRPFSAQ